MGTRDCGERMATHSTLIPRDMGYMPARRGPDTPDDSEIWAELGDRSVGNGPRTKSQEMWVQYCKDRERIRGNRAQQRYMVQQYQPEAEAAPRMGAQTARST